MARIVLVASGMVSGLNVTAELARRLGADGHEVVLATTARHRATVEALGLTFREIPEVTLWAFRCDLPGLGANPLARTRARRRARMAQVLERQGLEAFRAILGEADPDLVIVDFELHGMILEAVASGRRVALLQYFFSTVPGPGNPPLGSFAVPGMGPEGAPARVMASWRRLMLWKRYKEALYALKHWGGDLPSALQAHARAIGVGPALFDRRRWQYPWGYRLPILMTSPAELDFAGEGEADLRYVGPLIPEAPEGAGVLAGLGIERTGPGHRVLLAAFGTVDAPPVPVQEALWRAVGGREDWTLLHAIPDGKRRPAGDPPPNVRVVDWIDQRAALREVDALIHHGGVSSVREAAHAGRPQIVLAQDMMDRPGSAARVVKHGIGAALTGRETPEAMAAEIARVLDDAGVAAACETMAAASGRHAGARVAETEVRGLLEETPAP